MRDKSQGETKQGIRNREEYLRKKEENERQIREIAEMQQKVEEIERELAL